jgi:hypothetical protein
MNFVSRNLNSTAICAMSSESAWFLTSIISVWLRDEIGQFWTCSEKVRFLSFATLSWNPGISLIPDSWVYTVWIYIVKINPSPGWRLSLQELNGLRLRLRLSLSLNLNLRCHQITVAGELTKLRDVKVLGFATVL